MMTDRRILLRFWLAAIWVEMMSGGAFAFCPMCKTAVDGATGAAEIAGSLNLAALVLLAPPVLIFAALFLGFYRLRHASGRLASPDEEAAEGSPRAAL
jgi:hypothetical protein